MFFNWRLNLKYYVYKNCILDKHKNYLNIYIIIIYISLKIIFFITFIYH